eukprot:gene2349-4562_t
MARYIDHSLKNMKDLPGAFKATLQCIRRLDDASEEITQRRDADRIIDICQASKTVEIKHLSALAAVINQRKIELCKDLQDIIRHNIKTIDEDIELLTASVGSEESIRCRPVNIPPLEPELATAQKIEIPIESKSRSHTEESRPSKQDAGRKSKKQTAKAKSPTLDTISRSQNVEPTPQTHTAKEKSRALDTELIRKRTRSTLATSSTDDSEQLYCKCKKPLSIDMIICSNHDCPIRYYHCKCVDLSRRPAKGWRCPHCLSKKTKTRITRT